MLSLAEAHGKLKQSSYLNLIMAVGRQSIWVVAVFCLTKDNLLKDLIFPPYNWAADIGVENKSMWWLCEELGSEKFHQKGLYWKLGNTQSLGNIRKQACWFIEAQWGHTSLVSATLVYIKLYFKSDDYIGCVSVPVPKMPNKYQILSRASHHPYPLHLNHAN